MLKAAGKIFLLFVMLISCSAGQDGPNNCPNEWSCNNSNNYRYIPSPKTWVEAEIYCQNLQPGGHLASVHSLEENNFIQQLVLEKAKSNVHIWIGASDTYKDRTFMWTDGTVWDFQKWYPGEPNNAGGREPCLQFNFGNPGIWNDSQCSGSLPFVCKVNNPLHYVG
ncbi:lectin-like [Ambystoma mexicanum]|uniref:lectin-like n=1 Tax=Ambystoma mexicanum TaxID=8296 RepID=UPI0037E77D67